MHPVDYVIDILLVLVIFRQARAHELTGKSLLLPLVLLAAAAALYLRPTTLHGGGLTLTVVLIVVGAVLGTASGALDVVRREPDGRVISRATAGSIVFWVLGMGARFAFVYYAYHSGAVSVADFSRKHGIHGAAVWTLALFLMAVAQVLARLSVLQFRRTRGAIVLEPTPGYASR